MPRKRKKKEDEDPGWTPSSSKTKKKDNKGNCIIHCCDSNEPLTTLPSSDSWKNLLQAAEIRGDERILRLKEGLKDGEFPKLQYHLQCRKKFTHKNELAKINLRKEVRTIYF